ncbi:MAG: DUF4188 domain-containing protein [Bacteroidota bacterium]
MMIKEGRYFVKREEPFVIFMLGMRIHNLWNVGKWAQVYRLIPPMLEELEAGGAPGYLGSIYKVSFREPLIIQYWNSVEELHTYSKAKDKLHVPVWKTFNQQVGKSKDIGIWHETYTIEPSAHENIYVNMPPKGLGQFSPLISLEKKRRNYKERFKQS